MRKIVILGGGGFGREILSWISACAAMSGGIEVAGYADDAGPAMNVCPGIDLPYLGAVAAVDPAGLELVVAIGDPHRKRQIADVMADRGARFATIIHPTAVVTPAARIDEGAVIGPLTYIATNSRVGRLVSVNSLCGIGHDAELGAFSTISSQVDITGGVRLGETVFVGSGARIIPGVKVGDGARIGAGAVVLRNVRDSQTLFAAPARAL